MDTIANMLAIIKNAQAVKSETVSFPYSKIKMEVAQALTRGGFIKEVVHKGKKNKKTIDVVLGYDDKRNPRIKNIKRISKPSRRIYVAFNNIKTVKQGFGIWILSTPKGIFTSKEAKQEKVGGEVICEVY